MRGDFQLIPIAYVPQAWALGAQVHELGYATRRRMAPGRRLAGGKQAVSYRAKLLALFTVTVVVVTALVAGLASTSMRRSFERLEEQRTAELLAQFRREFSRRGDEVSRRVQAIAARDSTIRMAADLGRSSPDYAPYVNEAGSLAAAHQLDFLELLAADGTIISSAQWPARFGYKEEWIAAPVDWNTQSAFLKRENLPDGTALALVAVREVRAGDSVLHVVGGERVDRSFLATLSLPSGMRAMLYLNSETAFSPAALTDAAGPVARAEKLAPLVQRIQQQGEQSSEVVWWSADSPGAEAVFGIPLQRTRGRAAGCDAGRQLTPRCRRDGKAHSSGGVAGGCGGRAAWALAQRMGGHAGHALRRAARRRGARGGRGKLVGASSDYLQRRIWRAGFGLQPDDARIERPAPATGAGGTGCCVARTGAPSGPRAEESAVSAADHGGEPAAGQGAESGAVRGGVPRERGHAAGRNRQPAGHRIALQRLCPHARARAAAGAAQRGGPSTCSN